MAGVVSRITGPVVYAKNLNAPKKNHIVEVGKEKLLGEIIQIIGSIVVIQVYEETSGLGINEPVYSLNKPLTITLGPGLLGTVFDGIQRPLKELKGNFILRGEKPPNLSVKKEWHFIPKERKNGKTIKGGEKLGTVKETSVVEHSILVPPTISGVLDETMPEGDYKINEPIALLKDGTKIAMSHEWPVRYPRPFIKRISATNPFITGQRILDFLFPLLEGSSAMIPGGFGTGKTVLEHTLAKFSASDIMILTLCGERGNETADALVNFMKLVDPNTKKLMIERTGIIANTSNMPVAAREASIYAGITMAEYYRDMGYRVSMLADSTSRWAEALREISGRLGEIPGEEGFPTYLTKRIGQFYERAGKVETLDGGLGSLSIIGSVSPQGGDFSEPVTQYSMRFVSVLWALSTDLAYSRHYPAISWRTSYSKNLQYSDKYFDEKVNENWSRMRSKIQSILQEEEELEKIVRLLGKDTISESQKGLLLTGEIIREGFLQQNSYTTDAFSDMNKTYKMASTMVEAHELLQERIIRGNFDVDNLYDEKFIEDLKRLKESTKDEIDQFRNTMSDVISQIGKVV